MNLIKCEVLPSWAFFKSTKTNALRVWEEEGGTCLPMLQGGAIDQECLDWEYLKQGSYFIKLGRKIRDLREE